MIQYTNVYQSVLRLSFSFCSSFTAKDILEAAFCNDFRYYFVQCALTMKRKQQSNILFISVSFQRMINMAMYDETRPYANVNVEDLAT